MNCLEHQIWVPLVGLFAISLFFNLYYCCKKSQNSSPNSPPNSSEEEKEIIEMPPYSQIRPKINRFAIKKSPRHVTKGHLPQWVVNEYNKNI